MYGKSTFMVWRAVGLGLLTIMPAMAYTLKVTDSALGWMLWQVAAEMPARLPFLVRVVYLMPESQVQQPGPRLQEADMLCSASLFCMPACVTVV